MKTHPELLKLFEGYGTVQLKLTSLGMAKDWMNVSYSIMNNVSGQKEYRALIAKSNRVYAVSTKEADSVADLSFQKNGKLFDVYIDLDLTEKNGDGKEVLDFLFNCPYIISDYYDNPYFEDNAARKVRILVEEMENQKLFKELKENTSVKSRILSLEPTERLAFAQYLGIPCQTKSDEAIALALLGNEKGIGGAVIPFFGEKKVLYERYFSLNEKEADMYLTINKAIELEYIKKVNGVYMNEDNRSMGYSVEEVVAYYKDSEDKYNLLRAKTLKNYNPKVKDSKPVKI